ncbi:hypothetical protein C8N35_110155 [Breoghania corrubedonensis]|uniref:Uncharacterized protein n=1 Tax=Breoghania corrubedonensis TaxID=665038 RepID=A0A2T5V1R2_9HYPH|nr:hypothetical protein C8N35_110155 [Breoghania corrubedonensis]
MPRSAGPNARRRRSEGNGRSQAAFFGRVQAAHSSRRPPGAGFSKSDPKMVAGYVRLNYPRHCRLRPAIHAVMFRHGVLANSPLISNSSRMDVSRHGSRLGGRDDGGEIETHNRLPFSVQTLRSSRQRPSRRTAHTSRPIQRPHTTLRALHRHPPGFAGQRRMRGRSQELAAVRKRYVISTGNRSRTARLRFQAAPAKQATRHHRPPRETFCAPRQVRRKRWRCSLR